MNEIQSRYHSTDYWIGWDDACRVLDKELILVRGWSFFIGTLLGASISFAYFIYLGI